MNPDEVRVSQKTISFNKTDRTTGARYTYDDLVQSMKTNGWKGEPVDVVRMHDGTWGEAITARIRAQGRKFSTTNPFGATQSPRITGRP